MVGLDELWYDLAVDRPIDVAIVLVYNAAIVLLGCWFVRRVRSSDRFMVAGRSLPGWAVGLSIFGSYVSSISFLALPATAFSGNWNRFVFSISLPLAALIAARVFVPFYRSSGEVSAYSHLERRFGSWARLYAVACYLLIQLGRTGTVMYLLAVALQPLLGAQLWVLILVLGVVMTLYPLLGGTEAVIWTGVVQSVVLMAGAVVCAAWLLKDMPEGPAQIFRVASEHDKFSLGSLGVSVAAPTFWVVLFYGLVENLRNFGITQSYVQSYITAKSDRAARASVWMAALLYIPIAAVFLFIGTAMFAFFTAQPGLLPQGTKGDDVLPYFINTQLPPGIMGLIVAAICAAATDSNFNSMATLYLCDIHKRHWRPGASERESMWALRLSTLACGALSVGVALAMISSRSALDVWWTIAGIFGGAMLGLFLLGLVSRRAGNAAAIAGVLAGVAVILWMTASLDSFGKLVPVLRWPEAIGYLRSPMDAFMIPVVGTATILGIGLLTALVWPRRTTEAAPSELSESISADQTPT